MRVILILLLTAGAAQAVESSRVDLFLQLVRANGCTMDDAAAGRILPANGFTRAEVSEIEGVLSDRGWIDKTRMGEFALTDAGCEGS